MSLRTDYEAYEKTFLSPNAALSSKTKGRRFPSEPCDIRTEYQRDRDRIIHSKAFRRLKHKTQVFVAPEGDHYRTRLTHTLEVAQLARTIARALRLNEDLTEAIALGHDLGHTPFGHAGERMLDEVCPYGFKHEKQSLRVVDLLEDGEGLNLTLEVRNGIAHHTGDEIPMTLEGQAVCYADKIAYINHDIDDAIRGGIITADSLPERSVKVLGKTRSERISSMVHAVIKGTKDMSESRVKMADPQLCAMAMLREFLFSNVYSATSAAKTNEGKAANILKLLYEFFINNPEYVPTQRPKDNIFLSACDYVAGMTDSYAIAKFKELFLPEEWKGI